MKEIELSDGKKAVMKPLKGKHLINANRRAKDDPMEQVMIMVSETTEIDGKGVVYEDIWNCRQRTYLTSRRL